jgi:transposase-like protein
MRERGVHVDHSTINRWVVKYSPQLEEAFHRRKRSVWLSWRLDETYIKVKGQWYYLYRAVDKPTVSLGVTSAMVSSCGHDSAQIAHLVAQ